MEILDLTYAKHLYDQEEKRIEEQEKLFKYYIGDKDAILSYLNKSLEKSFDPDDIEEMQLVFLNITEKIINQLSIIYREPAEYKILIGGKEDEKLTEYYNSILPHDHNTQKQLAHRFAKLFNTSLTRVRYKDGIRLIVEPSSIFVIDSDEEDRQLLNKVLYDKYYKVKGKDELFKVLWTPKDHYKLDMLGNIIPIKGNEEMINPYAPMLPYATLRLKYAQGFWGEGAHDVVHINELVNFLLTVLTNESIVMGTAGTTLAVNLGLTKKGQVDSDTSGNRRVRTGKRHPISVEQRQSDLAPPNLQHVTTEPYIIEIRDTIDWAIKTIALSKGLNPNSFLQGVQATSGYSKIIDSLEQLEIRRDDIEPCRTYEHQLFDVIRKVNNTHFKNKDGKNLKEIPEEAELMVDFAEVEIPKTQDEIQKQQEYELQNNLTNYAKILMEKNPDLDENQAREQIIKNKEINEEVRRNSLVNRLINRGENGRQQQV